MRRHVDALFTREERIHAGPVFWVSTSTAPAYDQRVAIDVTNADLPRSGFGHWLEDVPHEQPFFAVIADGHAVALCASVRIAPEAHEASVETLPAYRRQGHVTAVVRGKLDPHVTIFASDKIMTAIEKRDWTPDEYGIPVLKFDSVLEAQVELGLGPLHTQFNNQGYAYTRLNMSPSRKMLRMCSRPSLLKRLNSSIVRCCDSNASVMKVPHRILFRYTGFKSL
jgi:hypothetical protein